MTVTLFVSQKSQQFLNVSSSVLKPHVVTIINIIVTTKGYMEVGHWIDRSWSYLKVSLIENFRWWSTLKKQYLYANQSEILLVIYSKNTFKRDKNSDLTCVPIMCLYWQSLPFSFYDMNFAHLTPWCCIMPTIKTDVWL